MHKRRERERAQKLNNTERHIDGDLAAKGSYSKMKGHGGMTRIATTFPQPPVPGWQPNLPPADEKGEKGMRYWDTTVSFGIGGVVILVRQGSHSSMTRQVKRC